MQKIFIVYLCTILVLLTGCAKTENSQNSIKEKENISKQQAIGKEENKESIDINSDSSKKDAVEDTTNNNTSLESSEESVPSTPVDIETLSLKLDDGKGSINDLSNYKDKLVFVNYFTTWCGYCMEEMPLFEDYYTRYKDKLEIIIVNVNHDPGEKSVEEVVTWYEEAGYTFPMVFDRDGKQTENYLAYIQGYPTTFVYNKGEFLGVLEGALDETLMNKVLETYLN